MMRPLCRRCWKLEDEGPHWTALELAIDPRDWLTSLHDFFPGRHQAPGRQEAKGATAAAGKE